MDPSELRFFQTGPHACGYLAEKQARNVFVDPQQELNASVFSFLSSHGFRRSGAHVYKPRCQSCQACQPLRVLVDDFVANRSQRRCLKRNHDLRPFLLADIRNEECYSLYERYINERHSDGDMFPPTFKQFEDFLSSEWGGTRYVGFRDPNDKLVSVAVVDCLHNALSAMYSFFDPNESKRSLGVFNILYQILWAKDLDLAHLYLGYLIEGCDKMSYKSNYAPYQLLKGDQWVTV